MMMPNHRLLPVATALAAVLTALAGAAQDPLPSPLEGALPELARQSSWAQDTEFEGEHPDKSKRGVYPVGNGRVFCYMGLGPRANTMQALTGPQYQTDEEFAPRGHFGELTLDLLQNGEPVVLPIQRVRRVRGAAFVVTEDSAPDGLCLRTLTFAVPEGTHLTRVITVENHGAGTATGVRLRARPEGDAQVRGSGLLQTYASATRPATACFLLTDAMAESGALITDLGDLAAGASWSGVLTISTTAGRGAPPETWEPVPALLDRAERDARAALSWWQDRLAARPHFFDTNHLKIRDLVNDWKVLMLVQRCAQSGVVTAMVNRRGASIRDSSGPLLAFLRFNMWDEARDILRYFHDAARLRHGITDRVPLDLDVDFDPGELEDAIPSWADFEVPAGDVASWVILQHFWYWRVTRDHALIREHWPLLELCLKKAPRKDGVLMTFGDGESAHDALYSVFPDRVADDSFFIADDPAQGRAAYSFASSVLFMMSVHAVAEMIDGLDRDARPERWRNGAPEPTPGERYGARAFALMRDLEQRFYLEDEGFFAPALSPVTLQPHRAPFANANLLPLWIGWTFPSGEKSRLNLRNSLARLWRRGHRFGSTPTVGYTTGEVQGMLTVAMAERDAHARLDCVDELVRLAEPAGEWGELYDPAGRPVASTDPQWPDRLDPATSGINLDALLYAMTGVRFNALPNWDIEDIRLEPRIPHGATFVTMKHIAKDGRELNLFLSETWQSMDNEERQKNATLIPEKQRDPDVEQRRMHLRVEQVSDDPPTGYWDLAINCMDTIFVRYLTKSTPIHEAPYWQEDDEFYMPQAVDPVPPSVVLVDGELAETLVLRARPNSDDSLRPATIVDTGMPARAADFAALLLTEDGRSAIETIVFEEGWDAADRTTFKSAAFWQDPIWTDALAAFEAAGGGTARTWTHRVK